MTWLSLIPAKPPSPTARLPLAVRGPAEPYACTSLQHVSRQAKDHLGKVFHAQHVVHAV